MWFHYLHHPCLIAPLCYSKTISINSFYRRYLWVSTATRYCETSIYTLLTKSLLSHFVHTTWCKATFLSQTYETKFSCVNYKWVQAFLALVAVMLSFLFCFVFFWQRVREVREDRSHLFHGGCQSASMMLRNNQWGRESAGALCSFNLLLIIPAGVHFTVYHQYFQATSLIQIYILLPRNKLTLKSNCQGTLGSLCGNVVTSFYSAIWCMASNLPFTGYSYVLLA